MHGPLPPGMTEEEELRLSFDQGIALFNNEDFFEAHEVWENCWNMSIGQERLNYQGLIQLAACCLQIQRGFFEGSRRLLSRAAEKFRLSDGPFRGVDLEGLYLGVQRMVAVLPMTTRGEPALKRGEFPKIARQPAAGGGT